MKVRFFQSEAADRYSRSNLVDAIEAARLPFHHGDPFDRMIVAQAQRHDLTLVTRDKNIKKYDVKIRVA
jgi:PIN domain nuclease of toxin-antitoxin system